MSANSSNYVQHLLAKRSTGSEDRARHMVNIKITRKMLIESRIQTANVKQLQEWLRAVDVEPVSADVHELRTQTLAILVPLK